ncbi:MAG TPA: glycosyltransferase [Terriglobales bacterium]|nr:glycosyltransferase [Terriglobales bacterium]
MKICLVTSFPPSHGRLNEYGFHLAQELQRDPLISVSVLADEYGGTEELPDFDVVRCWQPNSLSNPARILKAVREFRPDIVWFNTVFSSFGNAPAPAFLGLAAPALVRAAGYSTHITLHHLMEGINLADAGVRHPLMYHVGGAIATRLLLMANSVTVLLPAYRRTLISKYRGKNVHLRAHGVFAGTPQYPNFALRDNPEQRILAFGKWGTYKRLEILIEAFERVARQNPKARLVIAGENHPNAPGYIESITERLQACPQITVRGYVPEEDIAELFSTSSIMVMPYSSATGSSGVAHQACQFGVPIVCADIPDFHDMANEEQIAMDFFRRGDPESLAVCIIELLQDQKRRREMAERNFYAAMRMTMPQIMRQYLRAFDWHRRAHWTSVTARFNRLRSAAAAWSYDAHAVVRPTPALVPILTPPPSGTSAMCAKPGIVPVNTAGTSAVTARSVLKIPSLRHAIPPRRAAATLQPLPRRQRDAA